MLRSQINQFFRQLPAGRRALALVWGAAGWWTVAWAVLLVAQGLIPAGLALLLRTLVNRLVASHGWAAIAPPALGIAGLWVAGAALVQRPYLGPGGAGRAGAGRGPSAYPLAGPSPGPGLL